MTSNTTLISHARLLYLTLALLLSVGSGFPRLALSMDNPVSRERAVAAAARATERFVRDGDCAGARAGYQEAIAIDPTFPPPYFNLGVLAQREEDWDEAIGWFEEFLIRDGTSEFASRAREKIDLLRSIAIRERDPVARRQREYHGRLARIRSYSEMARHGETIAEAEDAILAEPTRFEAYELLGKVLSMIGSDAEASAALGKALELAPESEHSALRKAVEECRSAEAAASQAEAGLKALAEGRFEFAATQLEAAWGLAPSREMDGLAAASAWGLAGDFGKGRAILLKLERSTNLGIADAARRALGRINSAEAPPAGTADAWGCQTCHHGAPRDQRFCTVCGGVCGPVQGSGAAWGCPACKTEIPDGTKFCVKCGARGEPPEREQVRWGCPDCRIVVPTMQSFCTKCGGRCRALGPGGKSPF